MTRVIALCASLALVLSAFEAQAREFKVRQLDPKNPEVWGTREFQLTVSPYGSVRGVKLKGKEIIWQAVALYTFPVPPGAKEGIRRVQGEGSGKSGLTIEPPAPQTREEDGSRIFEYDFVLRTQEVLDGRPLCNVHEKLVITPTGEISVFYDFEWLQTLRWDTFAHLIIFNEENCRNRDYVVRVGDRFYTGKLDNGPIADRKIQASLFKQLTIRTESGPVHFVWDDDSNSSFHWGTGSMQLYTGPAAHTYRSMLYKGQKDHLAFRILLPVSQQ